MDGTITPWVGALTPAAMRAMMDGHTAPLDPIKRAGYFMHFTRRFRLAHGEASLRRLLSLALCPPELSAWSNEQGRRNARIRAGTASDLDMQIADLEETFRAVWSRQDAA